MEEINEKLHMQLLNFNETKRREWVEKRKPFSVLFELTPRCNMNCIHCYLQDSHAYPEMTTEEILKIIDLLYEKGILFLTLTGGEALTRKDFTEIYLYAKRKGFLVELFTNGYLINDELIELFRKYPPLLVDVSIYGGSEETYKKVTGISGAFSKVIENCKKLKNAGVRVFLKSPMLSTNIAELEKMKEIAREIDIPFIYTFEICATVDADKKTKKLQLPLSEILRYEFENHFELIKKGERSGNESRAEIIAELKKNDCLYSCNVALNSFVVDFTGRILPCMKLRHKGVRLTEDTFDKVWADFAVFSKIKATENYACKGCDAKYYCDVCPAEMEFLFGNAEYRNSHICKSAMLRRDFYEKRMTYDEVLKAADSE